MSDDKKPTEGTLSPDAQNDKGHIPTISYVAEGSPEDYRYVLRQGDLVLINENNERQIFPFVGNVMSLQGDIILEFANGTTLSSKDIFSKVDLIDMDEFDQDLSLWDANVEAKDKGKEVEGNTNEDIGAPDTQAEASAAIAETVKDLNENVIEQLENLNTGMSNNLGEVSQDVLLPNTNTGTGSGDFDVPPVEEEPTIDPISIKLHSDSDTGTKNDNITSDVTPLLEGKAEPNSAVEIFLGGFSIAFVTASSTGSYQYNVDSDLAEGVYEVYAVSTLGDLSAESPRFSLVIDIAPPVLPSIELAPESDSGTYVDDNYTNDNTPTLEGSGGEAGSIITVSYQLQGSVVVHQIGVSEVSDNGTWSFTPTTALPEGLYDFQITATDTAGNVNPQTGVLSGITIDITPPEPPSIIVTDDTENPAIPGSGSDLVTADTTPKFSGNTDPSGIVKLYIENVEVGQVVATSQGSWNIDGADLHLDRVSSNGELDDGVYKISAVAIDLAGNSSAPSSFELVIDTSITNPTINLISSSDTGTYNYDHITNEEEPEFSGTAEANSTVFLQITNNNSNVVVASTTIVTDAVGNWTTSNTGGDAFLPHLTDGNYTVSVVSTDVAGNESSEISLFPTLQVDLTPPSLPSLDLLTDSGVTGDWITNAGDDDTGLLTIGGSIDTEDSIEVTILDTSNGSSISYVIPDGPESNNWTFNTATGAWTVNLENYAEGTYQITAVSTDIAGNESGLVSHDLVIDRSIADVSINMNLTDDHGDQEDSELITNVQTPGFSGVADAGSTVFVTIYKDGIPVGASVEATVVEPINPGGLATWQIASFPTLAEGNYVATVTSNDVAGNTNSADLIFEIDTTRPASPTIAIDPDDDTGFPENSEVYTTSEQPMFNGSDAEPNARVSVELVKSNGSSLGTTIVRADSDGNWDWQYATILAEGEYTISAKVIDAAGNESLTATNYIFHIDLTPPPAPTANLSDDTFNPNIAGTGNDWITSDDVPSFSGAASSSEIARIRIYIDGTLVDEVTPTSGSWTSTPSLDSISSGGVLPQGNYSIDIVSVDKAGNESSPFEKTLVIDTQVTPIGTPELLDDSDSGRYDFDNLTNDKTPILHGNVEVGSTAVLRITGDGFDYSYTVSVDDDGNWQQEVTDEITVTGDYRAVLSVVDVAGNTVDSGSFTFTVDLDAPDAPSIDLLVADDSGADNTDHETNNNMPHLSGEAEIGSQVSIVITNLLTSSSVTQVIDVLSEGGVGKWSWQSATAMADGEYQITATAIDTAGNRSTTTALSPALVIDTEIITPTINLESDFGLYDDDHVTNTNVLDVNGNVTSSNAPLTFSGTCEKGATVTIDFPTADGSSIDTITIPSTATPLGEWTIDVTGLTDGTYGVSVYITDKAGNVSDTVDLDPDLVIDNTLPNAPVISDLATGEDTGYSAADNITQDRTPIINGTADAGARVVLEFFNEDGSTLIKGPVSTYADEYGNWTYDSYDTDLVSLEDNNYKVVAKTIDLAGNTSSGTSSINIVVDNVSPVAPELILLDDTGSGDPSDPSFTDWVTNATDIRLQGTIDAEETIKLDVAGTVYSLDPNQQSSVSPPWTFDTTNGTWTFTLAEADYPDNSYNISATRIDAAGNESSASSRTLVVDRTFDHLTIAMDSDDDKGDPDDGKLITYVTQPSFEGTVSEEAVSVKVIITDSNGNKVGSDYIATFALANNGVKTWTVNGLEALSGNPSADYTATVIGVDTADNAKEATVNFTIDTVDPLPTTFAMQDSDNSTRSDITDPDEVYTKKVKPTFGGEDVESNSRINVTLLDQYGGEIETVEVRANTSGEWQYTPTDNLNNGDYSIATVVIDAAGNSSTTTTESFTVDNNKPDPPTGFVLVTDTGSGLDSSDPSYSDGITSANPVVIMGSSEPYAEINIYDGATKIATVYADENGSWTTASTDPTGTVLPARTGLDGDVTYTFSATDKAGNISVTRSQFTYELDRDVAIESIELAVNSDSGTIGDGVTKIAEPNLEIVTEENSTVNVTVYKVVNGVVEASEYKSYSTGSPESSGEPTLYNIGLTGLFEGNYVVHVDVVDSAGNTHDNYSDGRTPFELTIDTSVPVITTLTDAPGFDLDTNYDSGTKNDGITNNTSPIYTGKTEPGAIVYLNVYDEGNNLLNATPFTGEAGEDGIWVISQGDLSLVTGMYSVKAWAIDAAGNSSIVEGTVFDLEIDEGISNPTIYLPNDQDSADDSDHVTNISNPTIKGWAEIDADLELIFSKTDGATVTVKLLDSNQDTNGNWSYTPNLGDLGALWDNNSGGLLDGSYSLSIRSTDAAGNSATTILNPVLEIDTEIPDTPTADIVDTGSQQTLETIVTNNGNLSGSYDQTDVEKILVYLDYSTATDAVNTAYEASLNSDGSWTLAANVFSPISQDEHTYRIVALDAAGNESTPVEIGFIYDTINPSFDAVLTEQDQDSGGSGRTDLINGAISAVIGGNSESGLQITISVNGDKSYVLPNLTTGTSWDFTFDLTDNDLSNDTSIALEQGDNRIEITAEDKAGNITTRIIEVELDNEPPAPPTDIDLATIDGVNYDSKNTDDDYTNADDVYLQGRTEPGTSIEINLAGNIFSATVDEYGNWTSEKISSGFLPHNGTGPTTYDFSVTAIDEAGNISTPKSYPIEIDRATDKPTVELDSSSISSDDTDEDGIILTKYSNVTLNGTAEKDSDITITITREDSTSFTIYSSTNENGIWTATTDLKSVTSGDGHYSVDVVANDKAGNISEHSDQFIIDLDTTIEKPTIALEEDTKGTLGIGDDIIGSDDDLITKPNSDGKIVLVGLTDTDTESIEIFIGQQSIGTAVPVLSTDPADRASWRFEYELPPNIEADFYNFRVVAVDTAGNENSATETIFIDNQLPDAPSFTALVDDTDTGNITTDEYTKLDTFTLSGTATEIGEDVAVHIYFVNASGSKVYVGRADMEDNSTSWTFSYTTKDDGSDVFAVDNDRDEVSQYKFVAVAEDKAGNQSPDSSDIDVQVDRGTDIPTIDLHEDSDSEGKPVDGVAGTDEDNLTNENTLILNGGGAEPGAKIVIIQKGSGDNGSLLANYEVTADALGDWIIPIDVGDYNDGEYYFYARAIDKAGNESDDGIIDFITDLDSRIADGEIVKIEIDHTAPWTSDVSLTITTDTGRSQTDGITLENNIVLTGSLLQEDVDRGLEVRVYKVGTTISLGTAKIVDGVDGANATWDTSNLNLNYEAGDYKFYIEVEDLAGNVTTSDEFEVTIDNTDPDTTSYLDISTNTAGNIGTDSDWITSSDTLTIKGFTEFSSYVYLTTADGTFVDSSDYGSNTYVKADPNTGAWAISIDASDYVDGSYSFRAHVTDVAGNTTQKEFTVSVDRTAPIATTVNLATGSDTGADSDDDRTFGNTISSIVDKTAISLTGNLASVDAGANVVAVYIYKKIENGSDIEIGEAVVTGSIWTYNFAPADNGVYTYYARVEDNAGNYTDSATKTITIDRTAPTTSLSLHPDSDTYDTEAGGSSTDKHTGADDLDLIVNLDADFTDIAQVEIFRKDGDIYTSLGTADEATDKLTWTFKVLESQIPNNQDYTFVARATDTAGNVEDIDTGLTVTIDRIDPTFSDIDLVSTDDSHDSLGLGSNDDDYTNDTTLQLKGNVESNGSIDIYITKLDGTEEFLTTIYKDAAIKTNWTFDNVSGDWTYDYTVSGQNDGDSPADFVFRAVAFDKAGNSTEQDITITVDRDVPDITEISLQQEGDDVPASSNDYQAIVNYDDVTLTGIVTESSADIVVAIYSVDSNGVRTKIGSSVLDADGNGSPDSNIGEVTFTGPVGGNYTWSYINTGIADGAHKFVAVVEDKAGNKIESAPYNLFIDNMVQAPTIALATASNSYWAGDSDDDNETLGSDSDLITNKTTITLTGTADTDSRIDVYIAGDLIFSIDPETNAAPDEDGTTNRTWSKDIDISSYLDSTLTLEDLTFTAVATDYAGNKTSSTDTTITFDRQNVLLTVDLLPSADPENDHDSAGFTGTHDDKITNATEITLTGTADANCHITIMDSDGNAVARANADSDGNWTISEIWNGTTWDIGTTIDTSTETGVVTYTIRSVDDAGNIKTTTLPITFDHTAPAAATILISEDTNTGDDSNIGTGGLTNLQNIVLEGLVDGGLPATGTPELVGLEIYIIDGGTETLIGKSYGDDSSISFSNNSWSLAYTLPVGSATTGDFIFVARTVDLAGNQTNSTEYPVEYDNELAVPTIDLIDASDTYAEEADGSAKFGDNQDENTKGQGSNSILSFDIDSKGDNIVTLYLATVAENGDVTLADSPLTVTSDFTGGKWTLSYTPTDQEKENGVDYTFVARVEDPAGNVKLSEPLPVTFDPVISQISIDLDDSSALTIPVSGDSADYRSSETNLTLSGSVEANALVEIFRGTDLIATIPASGTDDGSWTTNISFADTDDSGSYTFTAIAYDLAGNSSSQDLVVVYDKDILDTAPTIAININSNTGETGEQGTSDDKIITAGTENSEGVITKEIISLEGVFPDSYSQDDFAADPLTIELYDGTTKIETGVIEVSYDVSNGHYTWTATGITALEGNHNYHVVATDSVGNTISSDNLYVLVDVGFDTVSTILLDTDDDTFGDYYGENDDAYTSNHQFGIGGAGEAGSNVVISVTLLNESGTPGTTYVLGNTTVSADNTWSYPVNNSSHIPDSSGSYIFTATLTDRADNVESVDLEVTVDKDLPQFESGAGATPIELTTDSGTPGDRITNAGNIENGSLTLSGDLADISSDAGFQADDIVVYLLREGHDAVEATINADGTWSYSYSSIDEGTHEFRVVLQDKAGNTTTYPAAADDPYTVVVDRDINAPTVSLDVSSDTYGGPAKAEADGGVGDNYTSLPDEENGHRYINLKVSGDTDSTITVYLGSDDSGEIIGTSTYDNDTSSWSLIQFDATDPTYQNATTELTFIAVAEDGANKATSNTYTFTLDDEAPETSTIDLTNTSDFGLVGNDSSISNSDNLTNGKTLNLEGVLSEGADDLTVIVKDVHNSVTTSYNATITGDEQSGYKWSLVLGDANTEAGYVSEGIHRFTAVIEDNAGNQTDIGPLDVEVDRTAPITLSIAMDDSASHEENSIIIGEETIIYTNNVSPTFTVDNLELGSTLVIVSGSTIYPDVVVTEDMLISGYVFDPTGEFVLGTHTVNITARDQAGNESVTTTMKFVVDNVAEDITNVKLTDDTDTGSSDSDNITNNTAPNLEGRAEEFAKISLEVKNSNGVVVATIDTTADGSGDWSTNLINDNQNFDEGDYTVKIVATDRAGNVTTYDHEDISDPDFEPISFTVDTSIADTDFSMVESETNDTGFELNDQYTNNKTPTFTWDPQEEGLTPVITLTDADGSKIEYTSLQLVVNADDSISWTTPNELSDGLYVASITYTDIAGNTTLTTPETVTFEIDTSKPSLTDVNLAVDSDAGTLDDWHTNGAKKDAGITIEGKAELGSRIYVLVNGDSIDTIDGDNAYFEVQADLSWSYDLFTTDGNGNIVYPETLNAGNNSIEIIAVDKAGNETSITKTLNIDLEVNPVGTIELNDASNSGSKLDNITNDTTPTLTGKTEAGSTVKLYLGEPSEANLIGSDTVGSDGIWSITVPAGKALAGNPSTTHSFTAVITDIAENEDSVSADIVVDTVPPVQVDLTCELATSSDTGKVTNDEYTKDNTPVFEGNGAEIETTVNVYIIDTANNNKEILLGVITSSNVGSWVLNPSDWLESSYSGDDSYSGLEMVSGNLVFKDGAHVIAIRNYDVAGNISDLSTVLPITIDTIAEVPTIGLTADVDNDTGDLGDMITKNLTPELTIEFEAGSYDAEVIFYERNSDGTSGTELFKVTATSFDSSGTWVVPYPDGVSELGTGSYNIVATANDKAGNLQTGTSVLKTDGIPPDFDFTIVEDNAIGSQGIYVGDNIFDAATVTINITGGEVGSEISVLDAATGAVIVAANTVGSDGTLVINVATGIANNSSAEFKYIIQAKDEAGNTVEKPVTYTVDREDPNAPEIDLQVGSDTDGDFSNFGSDDDEITSDDRPQIDITVDVKTQIEIYFTELGETEVLFATVTPKNGEDGYNYFKPDGTSATATELGITLTNGVFTYQPPTSLGDGDYVFKVIATDLAGNSKTSTLPITIDTLYSPELSVVLSDESDNGAYGIIMDSNSDGTPDNNDSLTNDATPLLKGVGEAGSTIKVYVSAVFSSDTAAEADDTATFNGAVSQAQFLSNNTNWEYNTTLTDVSDHSEDGFYRVMVVSQDAAGNESITYTTIELDTEPPQGPLVVEFAPDPTASPDPVTGTDPLYISKEMTKDSTPYLSGTAEGGTRIVITLDHNLTDLSKTIIINPENVTVGTSGYGEWSYQIPDIDQLPNGPYTATITSTDKAGNVSLESVGLYVSAGDPEVPTIGLVEEDDTHVQLDGITSRTVLASDGNDEITITGYAEANTTINIYKVPVGEAAPIPEPLIDEDGTPYPLGEGGTLTDTQFSSLPTASATLDTAANGSWSWDIETDGQPVDGEYTYYAVSTYFDGKNYMSKVFTVIVDSEVEGQTEIVLGEDTAQTDPVSMDTGLTDDWFLGGSAENNTATDGITKYSSPEITGMVEGESTVEVYVGRTNADGDMVDENDLVVTDPALQYFSGPFNAGVAEGTADTQVKWSYTFTSLANDIYDVKVVVTDRAGNVEESAVKRIIVDSMLSAPTVDLSTANDTAVQNVDGVSFENLADNNTTLLSGSTIATVAALKATGFTSSVEDGWTSENDLTLEGTSDLDTRMKITRLTSEGVDYETGVFVIDGAGNYTDPKLGGEGGILSVKEDGSWTYQTGELADGSFSFEVTSVDIAGNSKTTPYLNVNIDTSERPASVDLQASSDTGPFGSTGYVSYTTDNITKDNTPTFTLYGDNDSTYLLYLFDENGDPVTSGVGGSSIDYPMTGTISGTFATLDLPALADGDYTIKMVTASVSGRVAESETTSFTIDTTIPVSFDLPSDESEKANSEGIPIVISGDYRSGKENDFYTNDNTPSIDVYVEPGTMIYVVGAGMSAYRADTDGDGKITVSLGGLLDGSYDMKIKYGDLAGNVIQEGGADLEHNFTMVVDTNLPGCSIDLVTGSDHGFNDNDNSTNTGNVTFVGVLTPDVEDYSLVITDKDSGDVLYTFTNSDPNGSIFTEGAAGANSSLEVTFGTGNLAALNSGNYGVKFYVTDKAGNTRISTLRTTTATGETVERDYLNIDTTPINSLVGAFSYFSFGSGNIVTKIITGNTGIIIDSTDNGTGDSPGQGTFVFYNGTTEIGTKVYVAESDDAGNSNGDITFNLSGIYKDATRVEFFVEDDPGNVSPSYTIDFTYSGASSVLTPSTSSQSMMIASESQIDAVEAETESEVEQVTAKESSESTSTLNTESDADADDIADTASPTFVGVVDTVGDVEVTKIELTLTGDTNGDGNDDVTITETVELAEDDSWSHSFASDLAEGEYSLNFTALNDANEEVAVIGSEEYDFSVLASEFTSEDTTLFAASESENDAVTDGQISEDSLPSSAPIDTSLVENPVEHNVI